MYLITDSEGYTVGVFTDYTIACEELLDYAGQVMDGHYIADYPKKRERDRKRMEHPLVPISYVTEGVSPDGKEHPAAASALGWHVIEVYIPDRVA